MPGITAREYGRLPDGRPVHEYRLDNGRGGVLTALDWGGIVTGLWMPDAAGRSDNDEATCDRPTVVNLTSHAYFNLGGAESGSALGHRLALHASRYTEPDATGVPLRHLSVDGTPFDFRRERVIGSEVGYDHNWLLDHPGDGALHAAAQLHDPASGRWMEVLTTEPPCSSMPAPGSAAPSPGLAAPDTRAELACAWKRSTTRTHRTGPSARTGRARCCGRARCSGHRRCIVSVGFCQSSGACAGLAAED